MLQSQHPHSGVPMFPNDTVRGRVRRVNVSLPSNGVEAESREKPSRAWPRGAADERADTVLESLIGETHHAASRIAIVASWTNALRVPESAINAPTIRALIPDDPAIMMTMRRWVRSTSLDTDTLGRTEEFFESLETARTSFDMFMREANKIGFVRAGILHRMLLSGAWQHAADRAVSTLYAQEKEVDRSLPVVYSANASALHALLDQVQSGLTPCLNLDGTIRLPELPNQRNAARRYLLENCFVKTERHAFSAFARDVSSGGMGLDRVPQIPVGARLTVKLPTGRLFAGHVRWYRNASAGIQFERALAQNDPLLSG